MIGNERIVATLLAEARYLPMTRHKTDVVTERKQAVPNRTDQIGVIAARKIAATETAGEDHVTNERQLRRRMMKDDVTRRVARTMEHVEAQAAEFDHIAVRQPAIRRKAARRRKAVARRRFGQAFDPEQVILVRPLDRHAKLLGA